MPVLVLEDFLSPIRAVEFRFLKGSCFSLCRRRDRASLAHRLVLAIHFDFGFRSFRAIHFGCVLRHGTYYRSQQVKN